MRDTGKLCKKIAARVKSHRAAKPKASYRTIAEHYEVDDDYENIRRIYLGLGVGDDKVIRIARAMKLIPKPRPPLDAYRPIIKPVSLREIASGREIAQLLAAMDEAGVNMEYVLEALAEKLHDDAANGPVTCMPYSVYGFNEMEGI